jgi:hypothetical protein
LCELYESEPKKNATTVGQFALLKKDLEGFLVKMRRAKRTLPAELWRGPGEAPRRASPYAAKIQPKGDRR